MMRHELDQLSEGSGKAFPLLGIGRVYIFTVNFNVTNSKAKFSQCYESSEFWRPPYFDALAFTLGKALIFISRMVSNSKGLIMKIDL